MENIEVKRNIIRDKSFDFSVRAINLYKSLEKDVEEIIKLLTTILKTTKQNINETKKY